VQNVLSLLSVLKQITAANEIHATTTTTTTTMAIHADANGNSNGRMCVCVCGCKCGMRQRYLNAKHTASSHTYANMNINEQRRVLNAVD